MKIILLIIFFSGFSCFQDSSEKELVIAGIPSDPSGIDPILAVDLSSRKINSLVFSSLFKMEKGIVKPDLIESYTYKNKTLTLKLADRRSFSGRRISSGNVIFSINRLKTESGPRKSSYRYIREVKVLSENELEMIFDFSGNKALELLALPTASIYDKDVFEREGRFESYGPLAIKEWSKGNHFLFNRNENFPEKDKYPKSLLLQIVAQPSSAIYLFARQKMDVMKIPYFLLNHPSLEGQKIHRITGRSVQYIAFNHTKPCYDIHFRKALNYAIDRKKIIVSLFNSSASEINTSIPDEYLEPITKEKFYYSYNAELAKEELKKSTCYPEILSKELELRMRGDDENRAKGALIAQYLKNIGLQIKVLGLEKTKLYRENSEKAGDLTLLTWYIDYDSISNFIDPLFSSGNFGNGGNRAFYKNDRIDSFIQKLRNESNTKEDTLEAVKVLYDDAPWIFLWSMHENYIISEKALRYSENLHSF